MNPTLNEYQSLLITKTSNRADMNLLLEASEDYMIPQKKAQTILDEVKCSLKGWRTMALRLGASQRDIDYFVSVFEK